MVSDTLGEAEARRQGYAAGRRAALEEAARVCDEAVNGAGPCWEQRDEDTAPTADVALDRLPGVIRALAEQEPQG